MRPSQLLAELHEANQRLARKILERDLEMARRLAATEADIAELRWLEKDYQEYLDDMSLGGQPYRVPR